MVEREASEILVRLTKEYHRNPDGVEVEFRQLCSAWPWAKRSDAYTHLFHRYPAKMLAYIPIFFLSTQHYAGREEPILDVFAGAGTVLLESIAHPVFPRNAYGVELNPLARLIAKVKTRLVDPDQTQRAAGAVVAQARYTSERQVPDFDDLEYWFPSHVVDAFGKLAWAIDRADIAEDTRDFLLACMSSTVRKCSYADPHIPVPVRLKPDQSAPDSPHKRFVIERLEALESVEPFTVFLDVVRRNAERMRKLAQVTAIADGRVESAIIWDDARQIGYAPMGSRGKLEKKQAEPIPDGCISLVITSPPYGSAQKYTRATKLEMLWLGLADTKAIEMLDKATIGTERVFYEEYQELMRTGYPAIDKTLEQVHQRSPYRAGLASAYFRAMNQVLHEVKRVLRPSGALILVVGDNTSAGIPVPNHWFLAQMAEEIGFSKELVLRDPVRSRGMITKRHETAGLISDDWVLVLRKGA